MVRRMKSFRSCLSFFLAAFLVLSTSIITTAGTTASAATRGITSGAIYKLTAKCSVKVLNVSNSSLNNAANIDQWTDTGSDAQRWRIDDWGDGYYKLTNIASGQVLDNGGSTTEGGNIQQWPENGSDGQKWKIDDMGNGYYRLTVKKSGQVLDVTGGLATDGVNVEQYTDISSDAQRWKIELQSPQEKAPTEAIAYTAMDSLIKTYYNLSNGAAHWGNPSKYDWGGAEMYEMVIDAYNQTGNAKYKQMIGELYNGFVALQGTNMSWNEYNDDVMWMVIANSRAYLATGDTKYRDTAKLNFDMVYARAWSSDLGGGLWWRTDNQTKNACINGPAAIAACLLYQINGDSSYLQKAKDIYNWERTYLFDATTGAVYDSYNIKGEYNKWSSTYNQGTFIGAATYLYEITGNQQYFNDAKITADYTRNTMFKDGVMNSEESGGDLPGFKGIFARWMSKFVKDQRQDQYIPWLQKNAAAAWNNRNSKGIMWTQWATRTKEQDYTVFGSSTAVNLLQVCPLGSNVKDAYKTIEAENFDELRGLIAETCNESGKSLGGIQNGYYSVYCNVDFGTLGAQTAKFRVSSATSGGTIEIRLGSTTGTLIGTCNVTGTGDWNTWATVSCPVSKTTGLKDVYLVYKGSGYLFNINWFGFVSTATPTNTPTLKPTNTPTVKPTNTPVGYSVNGYLNPDCGYSEQVASAGKTGFKVEISGTTFIATTDGNGYFVVSGITGSQSAYTIKVSKKGFLNRLLNNVVIDKNLQFGSQTSPFDMWAGDANQDNVINMADIMELAKAFNGIKGDAKYNLDSDFNLDDTVNMSDIMIIAKHFNKTVSDYPVIAGEIVSPKPTQPVNNTPTPTMKPTSTPTPTYTLTPKPTSTPINGNYEAWDSNSHAYAIGNKVSYNGSNYECIMAHTSNTAWDPVSTLQVLWKKI